MEKGWHTLEKLCKKMAEWKYGRDQQEQEAEAALLDCEGVCHSLPELEEQCGQCHRNLERLWEATQSRQWMHGLYSVFVILLLALMVISTEAGKGKKGQKGASECTEWQYGSCVPSIGDCGAGVREGTCNLHVKKLKCHVPCGWKKDFGADCKYKFGSWGECDPTTGTKNRVGTLKKALYNAECLATREVSKPCHSANGKAKTKVKGKKGKGKEN